MMNPITCAAILAYCSLLSAAAPVLSERNAFHLAGPEPDLIGSEDINTYYRTRQSSDGNSWILTPKNSNTNNQLTDVQPTNVRFGKPGTESGSGIESESEAEKEKKKKSKSKKEKKEKSSNSDHEEKDKRELEEQKRDAALNSNDPAPADTVPKFQMLPWNLDSHFATRSVVPEYDFSQLMPKDPEQAKEEKAATKGGKRAKSETKGEKKDEPEHTRSKHAKNTQREQSQTGPVPKNWRTVPHNRGTFGPYDPGFYGP